MAAKRSRRARKKERQKKRHTPPRHLLEQGRQLLLEGDGRGALDAFRQAQHGDPKLAGLPLQLFCAYVSRARQLTAKGLVKEAAAMDELAAAQRTAIASQELTEEDLVHYIDYLDGVEAFQVYADFLRVHGPISRVERKLADLLVVHRCWEALTVLEADHPLRRDAGVVQQAVGEMDAGLWEQSGALLQEIARRSPFAPWRLFCKAMVCFGAEDDRDLQQALDLLPEDFLLAHTVDEWRRVGAAEAGDGRSAVPVQVSRALGTEVGTIAQLADQLRQAIWKRRLRDVERLLPRLAEALYPEDPMHSRTALLQIIGLAASQIDLSMQAVHDLVRRLLPPERIAGVTAQIGLLIQQINPGAWNVEPAAIYLEQLHLEFPDARAQALARGRILESLARAGHHAGMPAYALHPHTLETLGRLIGEPLDDPEMFLAELMMASLGADPDYREGYHFLLELLRDHPANKPRIEKILSAMASRFPDDAQPCLELATFYYSKNAYRKAEAALTEAGKRSPHDERILDLQAIGYLKAADQSRKRGRFQRAAEDLQAARDLNRLLVEPLLRVKSLMLDLVSTGSAEIIEPRLDALAPGEQLRTLAVLLCDLEENSNIKNVRAELADELKHILRRKMELSEHLGTGEVIELLSPLQRDFGVLFNDLQVAPVLDDYWSQLMARLDGDDLIALFDILLDCGERAVVRGEIDRRLQGFVKAERDPLLLFYLAVIRHQEGRDYDSRRFREILDVVDATQQERLRAAAVRLALHTHGPLREALQHFEFEMLDMPLPFAGGGLPPLSELLGALAGIVDETGGEEFFGAPAGGLLADDDLLDELDELEEMIDENELRGAPPSMLKEFAGFMRSEPQRRRELERIARACEAEDLCDELSRELYALLFPRRRKRKAR